MSDLKVQTIKTILIPQYGRHRQATLACRAWVRRQGARWWNEVGHLGPRPQAYDTWRLRDDKMYRRALPIFKKVLP